MDLIDRQKAIGKIQTWLKHNGYSEGERNVMGCAIQMLESLPSAEPSADKCWGCNCPKMRGEERKINETDYRKE